jgi:ATP-dependent DNA helicase RecG
VNQSTAVVDSTSASEKKTEKTSEKILRLIGEDPRVTIADLARLTGLATRSVERNLKAAQVQGLVRRVGPDKGGQWELTKGTPHA